MDDASRHEVLYQAVKAVAAAGVAGDGAVFQLLMLLMGEAAPKSVQRVVDADHPVWAVWDSLFGAEYLNMNGQPRRPPRNSVFSAQRMLLTCTQHQDDATAVPLVVAMGANEDASAALAPAVQHNMPALCLGLLKQRPSALSYAALGAAEQLPPADQPHMLDVLLHNAKAANEDLISEAAAAGSVNHVRLLLQHGVHPTATALKQAAGSDGGTDAGRAELCSVLVTALASSGAQLSKKEATGASLAAAKLSRVKTCHVLVRAGANKASLQLVSLQQQAQLAVESAAQLARDLEADNASASVPEGGA